MMMIPDYSQMVTISETPTTHQLSKTNGRKKLNKVEEKSEKP